MNPSYGSDDKNPDEVDFSEETLDTKTDISLDRPDFQALWRDREERTLAALSAIDSGLAHSLFPSRRKASHEDGGELWTVKEQAVITIQKYVRGFLARKKYLELLYTKFNQDEANRLRRTLNQVEEGELLVENHQLEVQLEDNQSVRKNRALYYIDKIISIQRAWRAFKRRQGQQRLAEEVEAAVVVSSSSSSSISISSSSSSSASSDHLDMANRYHHNHKTPATAEMEDDEERAEETAAKEITDPNMNQKQGATTSTTTLMRQQELLNNNPDLTSDLPTMDWASLEERLNNITFEQEKQSRSRRDILRKLAMNEEGDTEGDIYGKGKEKLAKRLQGGMNLQICFVNEPFSDDESPASSPEKTSSGIADHREGEEEEEVPYQEQLEKEARIQLAQAQPIARMQMEIEKQQKKLTTVAQLAAAQGLTQMREGLTGKRSMNRKTLEFMTFDQLLTVVNDLRCQVESLNEELVEQLILRDELKREQDSRLTDIEDLKGKHA